MLLLLCFTFKLYMPCFATTVRLASAGDAAEWEMAIALNLTAPVLLTKAFAAGMVKNKVCCQQQFMG